MRKLIGVFAIIIVGAYIANPTDAISDVIPVIGLIDDAIVVLLCAKNICKVFVPEFEG